jgi:hypothetical protein
MKGRYETVHQKDNVALGFSLHPFHLESTIAIGEIKKPKPLLRNMHVSRNRCDEDSVGIRKKIGDQKSLERAKEKLFALRDSQFYLIASLSEQIAREGDKPGVDIAFLLITALIILS